MSTKQGYIKDFEDNKMLPETTTVMVTDVARSQALSASLLALVESNALGFPAFTTTDDWAEGTQCFYDRKLWNFTSDHAAGDWDANDVEEFSVKEYTDALANEVKSKYLKKGTYSADTAVGLADNLRGQTVDSEAYLIRPTGGAESEVANGVASVLGMKGNSCVWNQQIDGKLSDLVYNDAVVTISVADNIFNVIFNATYREFNSKLSTISGHKYYININITDVSGSIYVYTDGIYRRIVTSPLNFKYTDTGTGNACFRFMASSNDAAAKFKFQFFDLTLLGIDNLTTVAGVEEWLAEHVGAKPYYAYNVGEILSAQTLGIKTYGQNLLNPTTKQAKLIPYTWEENSNVYTIKNVPSGATATFTPDATGVAETVDISGGNLDITSYGSGILELSAATADTYVCMKWDGTKDNDVVPYEDHTYDFDVRKVYGKVNGEGEYVQCYQNGMQNVNGTADLLKADEAICRIGKRAYQSGDESDATVLTDKTNTLYVLETPITYTDLVYRDGGIDRPLADVLMNIEVNNWSMEEQLLTPYENGNPTSVPATINIQYGMDAVEAIDTLQKTTYTEGDVHDNLAAMLSCINTNCSTVLGGTFAVSDTATDNVFAFSFTPNTEPDVEPTNEGE